MKRILKIVSVFLLVAGCSGGGSNGGNGGDDERGKGACARSVKEFRLPMDKVNGLATAYNVLDSYDSPTGIKVLLNRYNQDRIGTLYLADEGGNLTTIATGTEPLGGIVRGIGSRICVAHYDRMEAKSPLKLWCADGLKENSNLEVSRPSETNNRPLRAVGDASGAIHVFAEDSASFNEIFRHANGTWRKIEKFESSISYTRDAITHQGSALACYINYPGYPSLNFRSATIRGLTKATECFLAQGNDAIFMMTENGFASIPAADLERDEHRFELSPVVFPGNPVRIVIAKGKPLGVSYRATDKKAFLEFVSLPESQIVKMVEIPREPFETPAHHISYNESSGTLTTLTRDITHKFEIPYFEIKINRECL